jgi:hypothetical protein
VFAPPGGKWIAEISADKGAFGLPRPLQGQKMRETFSGVRKKPFFRRFWISAAFLGMLFSDGKKRQFTGRKMGPNFKNGSDFNA